MKEIILLIVLIICIIVAVQNPAVIILRFLVWKLHLQKGLFILFFLVIGYFFGRTSRAK